MEPPTSHNSDLNTSVPYPTSQLPSNPSSQQQQIFTPAPSLATSRYNRQLLIPSIGLSGQTSISAAKVLIIGLGGLGCPAALYLAGAGVHTLGLVDHDVVEVSNLHRQIAHRESSVFLTKTTSDIILHHATSDDTKLHNGFQEHTRRPMTKVASALRACQELNASIEYKTFETQLMGQNALDIIREFDIVLDCTDNPATRYLISDCCVVLGKTLVSGAAQRLEGQIVVLNHPLSPPRVSVPEVTKSNVGERRENGVQAESPPAATEHHSVKQERGPCYRCVFPTPPSPELVQGCSEIGILGPVVGAIGTLMASETLRLIVEQPFSATSANEGRKPTMLLYNAWSADPRGIFRIFNLRAKRKDCVACGDEQSLREKGKQKISEREIRDGRMDYQAFCGIMEEVEILDEETERISAEAFLQHMTKQNDDRLGMQDPGDHNPAVIVDVREKHEIELGPKLHGSVNIPISKILRGNFMPAANDDDGNGGGGGEGATNVKPRDEFDELLFSSHNGPIYFVCQRGNDSQIAAKKLIDRAKSSDSDQLDQETNNVEQRSRWIGDIKGGFIAMEKHMQGHSPII